jgi:hypothetical protein
MVERRIVYCCSYDRKAYKAQINDDMKGINNIVVLFPRQFGSYKPQPHDVVVFDECHYGDKIGQGFSKHIYDGAPSNIWLSATPFAASLRPDTHIINVTQSECEGYLGIKQWLDYGKVYDNYDLATLIRRLKSNQYGIIRQRNKNRMKSIIQLIEGLGVTPVIYNQENPLESVLEWTRRPRSKPEILIVQGNLMQGDRIDNTNLSFTYENAPINVDTVVQSLIGRACGWKKMTDVIHVTNKKACIAYCQMWDRLWAGEVLFDSSSAETKWSNTVSTVGDESTAEATASISYIPDGYDSLPEDVKNRLKFTKVRGRGVSKRQDRPSTWSAYNDTKDYNMVMTKSYFGQNQVSEANVDELQEVIACYQRGREYNKFQTFARNGSTIDNLEKIRYGVFFVNTNELESVGIREGSCFLLTKVDTSVRMQTKTFTVSKRSMHAKEFQ